MRACIEDPNAGSGPSQALLREPDARSLLPMTNLYGVLLSWTNQGLQAVDMHVSSFHLHGLVNFSCRLSGVAAVQAPACAIHNHAHRLMSYARLKAHNLFHKLHTLTRGPTRNKGVLVLHCRHVARCAVETLGHSFLVLLQGRQGSNRCTKG